MHESAIGVRMLFSLRSQPNLNPLLVDCGVQPAIYVASLAAVEALRAQEKGQAIIDSVDVTCGLSLGEYTALAFAGAFRFCHLICLRSGFH